MSAVLGMNTSADSLIFAMDAGNVKSVSGVGNAAFTNAKALVKNLVDSSQNITLPSTALRLANSDYYTVVAIDYPEGTLGGTYVARHGITPGFNVTSGTKIYDSGRALHLWAFDNTTNTWVADSYFTGGSAAGHCYDNYSGAGVSVTDAANAAFVKDYNRVKASFPNCTFISTGSHRRDTYSVATLAVLYELGMPTGFLSSYVAAPEWVLVGKPNTGTGNSYCWVYENNNSQSAVAVVGLKNIGNGNNYFQFDAGDKRIDTPISSFGNNATWEAWINCDSDVSTYNMFMGRYLPYFGFYGGDSLYFSNSIGTSQQTVQTARNLARNTWYYAVFTTLYDGVNTTMKIYTNGVESATGTFAGAQGGEGGNTFSIGNGYNSNWYRFSGKIAAVKIHSRTLTAIEIKRNFEAQRSRFGI